MQSCERRGEWRRSGPKLAASLLLVAFGPWVGSIEAQNGGLVGVGNAIADGPNSEKVDIAWDSSSGTHLVLCANGSSQANHSIHRVDELGENIVDTYDNPHPAGSIQTNDLTIHRGIAYHSIFRRIYVLAQVGPRSEREFRLAVLDSSGNDLEQSILVRLEKSDASLNGLTFNPLDNSFRSVDTKNGEIVRIGSDGTTESLFTLPGKVTEDTVLRVTGITIDAGSDNLDLYVTYGDVLSEGPTKIIQVTDDGELVGEVQFGRRTGIEVPLAEIPSSDIRGISAFRTEGDERRFAVIADRNRIFLLRQEISAVPTPTELSCSLTASNHVSLSWVNNGAGDNGATGGEFTILRNGVAFATVPDGESSFLDVAPGTGESSYAVVASDEDGVESDASCECTLFVGAGGLIDWAMAPGANIYDVTEDPATGHVYVTDDSSGNVTRLGPDLLPDVDFLLDADLAWPNSGGIAYLPTMTFGLPPEPRPHLLAVANTSDNRVRIIDLETERALTTISLRFDAEGADVDDPRIGGLTFIPGESITQQIIVCAEKTTNMLFFFRPSGQFIRKCVPQSIFLPDLTLGSAVTFEPNAGTLLATVDNGLVRELLTEGPSESCPIADAEFELSLESVGSHFKDVDYVSGIQASGSTLLVAVRGLGIVARLSAGAGDRNEFLRGDANGDSAVGISDIIFSLAYLFQNGAAPGCDDAADANDDGRLSVSDGIFGLYAQFVPGSPTYPEPTSEPGPDPSRDQLSCANPPTP